jgi:hypothetical protein
MTLTLFELLEGRTAPLYLVVEPTCCKVHFLDEREQAEELEDLLQNRGETLLWVLKPVEPEIGLGMNEKAWDDYDNLSTVCKHLPSEIQEELGLTEEPGQEGGEG